MKLTVADAFRAGRILMRLKGYREAVDPMSKGTAELLDEAEQQLAAAGAETAGDVHP